MATPVGGCALWTRACRCIIAPRMDDPSTGDTGDRMAPSTGSDTPEPTDQDRGRDRPAARLFRADRSDERLELEEALERPVAGDQLLWIDSVGPLDAPVAEGLRERIEASTGITRALRKLGSGPEISVHGKHLHLRVMGDPGDALGKTGWLDILVARDLVLTAHAEPAEFLERLDDRIKADATLGRLTAASFLRSLLDAVITTYYEAVDSIEDEVDALDTRALVAKPNEDILSDLVHIRRRIARIRRLLSDHREVYAALAATDVPEIAEPDDEGFSAVHARFEGAIHSVEDSRDLLFGSFDVYMSRLAQRTNDAMKILALATTLLLPGSLIAGLLGMNVIVPLSKDDPTSFWIVVIGIVALAALVLVVAWR